MSHYSLTIKNIFADNEDSKLRLVSAAVLPPRRFAVFSLVSLLALIFVFAALYFYQENQILAFGQEIKSLKGKLEEVKNEGAKMEIKMAAAGSAENLKSAVDFDTMEEIGRIIYVVSGANNIVSRK